MLFCAWFDKHDVYHELTFPKKDLELVPERKTEKQSTAKEQSNSNSINNSNSSEMSRWGTIAKMMSQTSDQLFETGPR